MALPLVFSNTATYTKDIVITPAYAQEAPIIATIESLEDKVIRIAKEHKIATTTLFNLIKSESSFNPNQLGDMDINCKVGVNKGKPVRAKGLVQITDCYNPDITDDQAFDPDFAINFGAKEIAQNGGFHFVSCNCVAFVRAMGVKFPRLTDAKDLDPNSIAPVKGGVVISNYRNTYHLSFITSVETDGIHIREANYSACSVGKRILAFDDKNIVGYFTDKI